MSTYEERSRDYSDGHLIRIYCRSCDQYFNGLTADKECQVCQGAVTPERVFSDTEMLDWCNEKMASITYAVPHGWRVWIPFTITVYHGDTLREAIRAAMKADQTP